MEKGKYEFGKGNQKVHSHSGGSDQLIWRYVPKAYDISGSIDSIKHSMYSMYALFFLYNRNIDEFSFRN